MSAGSSDKSETLNEDAAALVLRDDRIIETIARLEKRIGDRFPASGLARLCGQLHHLACEAAERSTEITRPIRWIRFVSAVITAVLFVVLIALVVVGAQTLASNDVSSPDLIQTLDAGLNELIFLSLAIVFMFSLETRIKRRRALAAIHKLRSIAHVIDMHQLTKDPERFLKGWSDTAHSPKRNMTPQQLNRYLDYCCEMLSLTGKIAAIYVQRFNDADAVNAVSEVEQLTTGLSRKIFQKTNLVQQLRETGEWSADGWNAAPAVGSGASAAEHQGQSGQAKEAGHSAAPHETPESPRQKSTDTKNPQDPTST